MLDYTHVLVGLGTMAGMYVVKLIKDKLFPEKVTPPVVVNITITPTADSTNVKVDASTDVQLLKG